MLSDLNGDGLGSFQIDIGHDRNAPSAADLLAERTANAGSTTGDN
jgi:hypothetical protein